MADLFTSILYGNLEIILFYIDFHAKCLKRLSLIYIIKITNIISIDFNILR